MSDATEIHPKAASALGRVVMHVITNRAGYVLGWSQVDRDTAQRAASVAMRRAPVLRSSRRSGRCCGLPRLSGTRIMATASARRRRLVVPV